MMDAASHGNGRGLVLGANAEGQIGERIGQRRIAHDTHPRRLAQRAMDWRSSSVECSSGGLRGGRFGTSPARNQSGRPLAYWGSETHLRSTQLVVVVNMGGCP